MAQPSMFYLPMGVLFSIYALDLLFLVVVAFIAKACESGVRDKHAEPGELQSKGMKKVYDSSEKESNKERIKYATYPMVLIQLPMYNEEEFCGLIIERVCAMKWPRDKLLIQVLDDSTKDIVRKKVDIAAISAVEHGHPVQVLRRTNRQGYKAGALVEGLKNVESEGFKYVVIFDADFEPSEDFLTESIIHLEQDPTLAFVQTRWTFANVNSFLTWSQKVNLMFHFDVEQRARSYLGWFFNFNGTAGVWRISAIDDAGGWESDTVVEDMDLSLRAYLKGWNAVYLDHVRSTNELPSTLSSYKTQQFRWLSGPMQILVKCFRLIIGSQHASIWRRLNSSWFFLRYILFALITLAILTVPPVQLWLEHWTWTWDQLFFMASVNFALAVYLYVTPFSITYLLFSIIIGYFKTWAMISGLVGMKKSKTWKVTQKIGVKDVFSRVYHKPYIMELVLCVYYGLFSFLAFRAHDWGLCGYCGLMATSFLYLSFGDYYM